MSRGTAWMAELGCSFRSMLHNSNYVTFFTIDLKCNSKTNQMSNVASPLVLFFYPTSSVL
jgi:hypothetical protein